MKDFGPHQAIKGTRPNTTKGWVASLQSNKTRNLFFHFKVLPARKK